MLITAVAACKDYGEFTVAERKWVDNQEMPALSEMDLTGINLEFAVGSEAHARVLPEADWPDPIGMLLDRVKKENGGTLPPDFDLPLEDGCIYVGLDPAYSRFRRIEFQGRVLLLVTYRVGSRVSGVKEEDQPNVEQRLAIIDESTGMTRYDFLLDSNRFELVRTDTTLGVVSINDASILLRRLEFRGDAMTASEPILLASSNHGIDRLAVENEPDRSIHLAWLTERVGAMPERAVRYLYFKPDDTRRNLNLPFPNEESDGFRQFPRDSKLEDPEGVPFTETARGGLLNMRLNDQMLWVYWVDSRFVWRGFERKNYSKLMTQPVLIDGKPQQSLAINIPKDDSDNADEPWLLWSHENAQFFAWSHASGGEPQEVLLQLSALDLETRNLRLARQPIHFRNIVAEAVHQNVEYERTRPVPDHPVPDSDECDNWEERLNLKPTGFGIMTPEGEQPITRLGTKKNGDNDQG